MYMTTKETLARQYLAERRVHGHRRGWAQAWASQHHSDKFAEAEGQRQFLKNVRRYAHEVQTKNRDHCFERDSHNTAYSQEPAKKQAEKRVAGETLGLASCT